jgi:hypothetical protein
VERPWQLPGFFFCRLFTHIGEISFPYGRDKGETSPNYATVNWPKAQEIAYPNKRSPMKQFNKEKRKEKTDRGRKKEKKKKAIFQGRRRPFAGRLWEPALSLVFFLFFVALRVGISCVANHNALLFRHLP